MSIKLYDVTNDTVIRSTVGIAHTTYKFAIDQLCPLIDRLDIQRNPQSAKMYQKMQEDILQGAILPPITVAFVKGNTELNKENAQKYISENIQSGFILDGIQRLSAIQRIHNQPELLEKLNYDQKLYLTFVISPSHDTLLYRMITLNNGQKPMSPRHQIEALYSYMDFDSKVKLHTEKSQTRSRSEGFKKANIIKAYLGYMNKSPIVDNNKIIESKMDELLVNRIIENRKAEGEQEFSDVLELIHRLCEAEETYKWFTVDNNIIGFCASIRLSYNDIKNIKPVDFYSSISNLETFINEYLERSKINVGTERRRAVSNFIKDFHICKDFEESEISQHFMDKGYI